MKIRKCSNHEKAIYTIKEICPICKSKTKDAHYKHIINTNNKEAK